MKPCHSNRRLLLKALLILAMLLGGCSPGREAAPTRPGDAAATPEAPADATGAQQQTPDDEISLRLVAVGDNLIHGPIYRGAKQPDGSYDFTPTYQGVAPLLQGADLAFVNQETPLGGTELGLSSYPAFNSPQEVGQALSDLGFNLVSVANNHALDAGQAGLERTLACWQNLGVTPAGTGDIPVVEAQGVKVALLAYTYGTNQGPLGLVETIDKATIAQQVAQAKELADVLLVSMHWGLEYQQAPSAGQQEFANYLASLGVDVVLGHHPHVVQPTTRLPKAGGGETLVFYSLGNFISNQNDTISLIGALAQVDLTYQPSSGQVSFPRVETIPLISQYEAGYQHTKLVPWQEYTPELAAQHGSPDPAFGYDYLQSQVFAAFPQLAAEPAPAP